MHWLSLAAVILPLFPFLQLAYLSFWGCLGVGFASAAKVASKGPLRLILLVIGLSLAEYARGLSLQAFHGTGQAWCWPIQM